MFQSKTVFVLGAGASQELKLPIGAELTAAISRTLALDTRKTTYFAQEETYRAIISFLQLSGGASRESLSETAKLSRQIAENMPIAPSIDNYLNTHRNDQRRVAIGKLAIAKCIIEAERTSYLHREEQGSLRLPTSSSDFLRSWYIPFWQTLVAGVDVGSVEMLLHNLKFIIFNYDRCFEHFLFLSIQSYFGVDSKFAAEIINRTFILHPYGKVGGLPWEVNEDNTAPFGKADPEDLPALATQIRTFTESAQVGLLEAAKDAIASAETLVLLGFGYIDQNLAFLAPSDSKVRRVFATAYGMVPSELNMVTRKLQRMLHRGAVEDFRITLENTQFQANLDIGECRDLMAHHRLRLSDTVD